MFAGANEPGPWPWRVFALPASGTVLLQAVSGLRALLDELAVDLVRCVNGPTEGSAQREQRDEHRGRRQPE
jgi:hypothetical protein